jgi:transcriptional regulator with XRE-family HTH domain
MERDDAEVAGQLGSSVRTHRRARGWSQAHLAELVELTPNYVGMLERGERVPTVSRLLRIASVLKTTPNELLGIDQTGAWTEQVLALAHSIPPALRDPILALLSTAAAQGEAPPTSTRAKRGSASKFVARRRR